MLLIVNTTQPDPYTWALGFSGKLNFQARQTYQGTVNQAEGASPRQVIFDFTEFSYIDSAGLWLLTLTYKKLAEAGIQLSIATPQESVRQVLQ